MREDNIKKIKDYKYIDNKEGIEIAAISGYQIAVIDKSNKKKFTVYNNKNKFKYRYYNDDDTGKDNPPPEDEPPRTFYHDKDIICIAFSSDGNKIAVGSKNHTFTIYDLNRYITIENDGSNVIYKGNEIPFTKEGKNLVFDKNINITNILKDNVTEISNSR